MEHEFGESGEMPPAARTVCVENLHEGPRGVEGEFMRCG